MGCDIHGMFERKDGSYWLNSGDPDLYRNYTIFSILANVRNSDKIPFIEEKRLIDPDKIEWCSSEFRALTEYWRGDGHSHSYVTLEEMKNYDITQKYFCNSLILSKDETGKITSTCGATTEEHLGKVGEVTIFEVWGDEQWQKLIQYGENIRKYHNLKDDEVRYVFFFDN